VSINNLHPGDVLVDGSPSGTTFIAYTKKNATAATRNHVPYYTLHVTAADNDDTTSITLTPHHRVILLRDGQESSVPARDATVGDVVIIASAANPRRLGTIRAITQQSMFGYTNFITESGRVAVDGVVASCFTESVYVPGQSDDLLNIMCKPLVWLFEISPELAQMSPDANEHWYLTHVIYYPRKVLFWLGHLDPIKAVVASIATALVVVYGSRAYNRL
jgi:hypothetical protein